MFCTYIVGVAPLGDLVGINHEAVVTAYQFGNGLTNLISPTGGVLLAGLAIARISFGQWLKVIFKPFPILCCCYFCCGGYLINQVRTPVF
ncbi:hypothetical protein [Paenibacillus sp. NPDC055715]